MPLLTRRLVGRLALALCVFVAVVEGTFAWFGLRGQERQLLRGMVQGADQLSSSITNATWHAMLADRRGDVYQTLQAIGQEPGIENIRIFNKEGRVTFSTDPSAAQQVDKNAEACFLCHARGQSLVRIDVPGRARVYRGADDRRRLAMVTPIYNEPSCSLAPCHAHPEDRAVLGVLDITMGLDAVDREMAAARVRAAAMTLTQIVLMTLLILFLTRRLVAAPIAKLIAGTQAVGAMDLGSPIEIDAPEELRSLAESFNDMRERLRAALDEIHQFTDDLEAKVEERSRQLQVAQQKLVQSDRLASLGQLSASMAHEINNPISGVLNLSMLVQRIIRDDGIPPGRVEEVRRHLTRISEETTRVGRIVTGLLAFSRRPAPRRIEADLNRVVQTTVGLVSHKLELLRVRTDLQLDADLPRLECDDAQMQQVLINLIMNAAEAMPGGGVVAVRTRFEAESETLLLEVEDSGMGITESNLRRIFDPFFTTKGEGKGVGLGLSVVYGIVQAHAGSIDVTSRVGSGTRFVLRLPRRAASDDGGSAVTAGPASAPAAPTSEVPS